jgi:hypothetical protein
MLSYKLMTHAQYTTLRTDQYRTKYAHVLFGEEKLKYGYERDIEEKMLL